MAPYAAGAFDRSGTLRASVSREESYRFGYRIDLQVWFSKSSKPGIGLLDEFCDGIGVVPTITTRERDGPDDETN